MVEVLTNTLIYLTSFKEEFKINYSVWSKVFYCSYLAAPFTIGCNFPYEKYSMTTAILLPNINKNPAISPFWLDNSNTDISAKNAH